MLRPFVRIALVAAAIALLWRAMGLIGWAEVARLVREADPRWTVLGVALLAARYAVNAARWRLALRRIGPLPSILHSFLSVMGGICANNLTPTLPVGGLVRARLAGGRGERGFGSVYGAVLFDQVAHNVVVILNGCLALLVVAVGSGRPGLAAAGAAALLVATAVVSSWLRRLDEARVDRVMEWLERRRSARGGARIGRLREHGRAALGVVHRLLRDGRLRLPALLLGLGFVALNSLAQWVLFLALGCPVDPLTVWVAVTIGVMTGYVSGMPGGVGTTEAGMVVALSALGVPQLEATASTLLYRGLHYAVMLSLGLPALVLLEARVRRRRSLLVERAAEAA
jgi:uncharacterized protein (TIRG00374 family)